MEIKVTSSILVGGTWHEPGTGNYEPKLAQFLIDQGAAVSLETKVNPPVEVKKKALTNAGLSSQAARVSPKKTRK